MYDIIYSLTKQRTLQTKWLENIKHLVGSNGYGNIW